MSLNRITGAMAALVAFRFTRGGSAVGVDTVRALITDLCHVLEVAGDIPARRGVPTVDLVERIVQRAFRQYVKEREEEIEGQELLAQGNDDSDTAEERADRGQDPVGDEERL